MKGKIIWILLILLLTLGEDARSHPFTIVSYNVENFFDCQHDSLKDDYEFLPDGEKQWSYSRLWEKSNNLARAILQCGERDNAKEASIPDIVGMVEVENDSVMTLLTRRSLLRYAGYQYVITQSHDVRGVDVALLYNPLTFAPFTIRSISVETPKGERPTRDILYVAGHTGHNDTLHIFVVHAPSRRGGKSATEAYRMVVAETLCQEVTALRNSSLDAAIVIMGDFNDYTGDRALRLLTSNGMVEVSSSAVGRDGEETGVRGTYKYGGEWRSLDHIFLSPSLMDRVGECYISDRRWLLKKDEHNGGYQPYRTYLGTAYTHGVSDHLPLVLILNE